MRAAIHVRRSTDEHQAESLTTQEASARTFCELRGWEVVQIFSESGVSRSEFKKRPVLLDVLEHAEKKGFDVLVTRDPSRLVGDTFRVGLFVEALLETGARLFYYHSNREIRLDDGTWKISTALEGWKSEEERKAIAGRTREALEKKHKQGFNTGGKCFGYDNVRVFELPDNQGRKLRTEYKINESEAATVREIHRLFADGHGLRWIARHLNDRGVPSPRGRLRATGSWDQSSVRGIIHNERYSGVLVWGRVGSRYKGGTLISVKNTPEQCQRVEAPHLRIVPEDLAAAVRARIESNRRLYGTPAPTRGAPKYLLGGLARCGGCGGPMHTVNDRVGKKQNIKAYSCRYNHVRGSTVCAIKTKRPMELVDAAVLGWVQDLLFRGDFAKAIVGELRQLLNEERPTDEGEANNLAEQAAQLKTDIKRLVAALEKAGEAPEAVVTMIARRERTLRDIEGRIAAHKAAPGAIEHKLTDLEASVRKRLAALQQTFTSNPQEARATLASLLDGPLTLTPTVNAEGRTRYEIRGRYVLGPVLLTENVSTSSGGDPNGI